jgi:hypothetical protein
MPRGRPGTSISAVANGTADTLVLDVFLVPDSATSCDGSTFSFPAWRMDFLHADPFAVAFPTPLQVRVPAGNKVCLYASISGVGGDAMRVNASGFLGD